MTATTTKPLLLTLCLFLPAAVATAQDASPLEPLVFKGADGKELPYRFMKPADYDPAKKYPLVVFLHGAGERGTDNKKQLVHGAPQFATKENREKYPCFVIAPQCPANARWVEVDWGAISHKMPEKPSEPLRLTMELVEKVRKDFPIDDSRIYATGLSMGGYGAWDLISRHPTVFAAAVPVCGGGDEAQAEKVKDIPVWAFHGEKDGTVKPARSRNMVAAIEKAGGKPKLTEYPNVGHNSWSKAYADPAMFEWLFTQKKSR